MKHCPTCQTNYADDTLQFCLEDGTRLTDFSNASMPTVAFNETETVVKSNQPPQVEPLYVPETQKFEPQNQVHQFAPPAQAPPKSNTAMAVLLTAFAMLLLFGAGLGAWLFLGNRDDDVAKNGNRDFFPSPTKSPFSNVNASPTASPSATPATEPSIMRTPPPEIDAEQITSEVSAKMNAWKSSMESGNLDSVMSHYASRLDYYYRASGVSSGYVRSNKKPAFEKYYSFRVNLGNMRITPDASGEKATVVFTKSWVFEGSGDRSDGSVRAQFQLSKIAGSWYITGEKDL